MIVYLRTLRPSDPLRPGLSAVTRWLGGAALRFRPTVVLTAAVLTGAMLSGAMLSGAALAQPGLNPIAGAVGAVAATPLVGRAIGKAPVDPGVAPGVQHGTGVTVVGAKKNAVLQRCRLDKPLFGASPARLKCYALAAFKPPRREALNESAMLGDPSMDHEDDILEELDVPDGVRDSEDAVEVMRAWVADGALHVIFDPETFRHDVSEWGRLLGDVAQHISNAVELDGQMSRQEALSQIHDAIEMSVNTNAVTMEGKIKGRTEH